MDLKLSLTSDYSVSEGNPEHHLKKISGAGFTHVHWDFHWNDDFIYSDFEIDKISEWLEKYNLKILDVHASEGREKYWASQKEYQRRSGVELVKNRIYMASRLFSDVIILHFKREPRNGLENTEYWDALHDSLDELEPYAREHGVRIALENYWHEDSREIKKLFSEYDSDFLGFCYDSGHGNLGDGLRTLEELKDRLISIHLHDNDGIDDQHNIVFTGTIDWRRFVKILVRSSYKKCVSMESAMYDPEISDEEVFLSRAYRAGEKLSGMADEERELLGREKIITVPLVYN